MSKESKQEVTLEEKIRTTCYDYYEGILSTEVIENTISFWISVMRPFLTDLEAKHKAVLKEAKREVAQECYLQCLAVECGEGECAQAIRTKFNLLPSKDEA